jgi:lipopolysaccharide/colanic/teichoic acid biosynthesis glycosyltransferase
MDQNCFSIDESLYVERAIAGRVLFNIIKRCFDIEASVTLLFILFPVSFLVALLHLSESSGCLFFVQKRAGYGGTEFRLMKYRTMVMDAEKDGPGFAEPNDCRITRTERFMLLIRSVFVLINYSVYIIMFNC